MKTLLTILGVLIAALSALTGVYDHIRVDAQDIGRRDQEIIDLSRRIDRLEAEESYLHGHFTLPKD